MILGRVTLPQPAIEEAAPPAEPGLPPAPKTGQAALLQMDHGPTLPVNAAQLLGDTPQGIPLNAPGEPLRHALIGQVEKEPSSTLWVLLGWSSKDARSAATYFKRALDLDPENPVARDGLAWALAEIGEIWPVEAPPVEVENLPQEGKTQAKRVQAGPHAKPPFSTTAAQSAPLMSAPKASTEVVHAPHVAAFNSARALGASTFPLVRPAMAGLAGQPRPHVRDFRWRSLTRFYQIPFFRNLAIATLYLLLISAAEFTTVLGNATIGIIFHATIMITLLIHGSVLQQGPFRRYLIILSLAPLIRLLSMSIPMASFAAPIMYRYVIVGVPIFLAAYFAARALGLTPNRLYFTWKGWPFQLLFSLIGFGLGFAEFYILRPASLVPSGGWFDIGMAVFILFVFTGFLEEFVFRSLLQVTGIQLFGSAAIWMISILFGVLHIGYYSVIDVIFAASVGLCFGYFALKTRSLLGISLAHGITNITLYIILPFFLH